MKETLNPQLSDWEKLAWQETPYPGVFISLIAQEADPQNPRIPKYTVMAVRVDPGCHIPLHRHNREPGWQETLTLPGGGGLEITSGETSQVILTDEPVTLSIETGEVFGLKNNGLGELYFYSRMQPGFTGYGEIEEIG